MKRGITAVAAIGNILEFYDFFLFGLLIPFFPPVSFPRMIRVLPCLSPMACLLRGF